MFKGIFVQYEEDHIGWWVRDLKGKYHFARDVEFDEDTPSKLSSKHKMMDPPSNIPSDDSLPNDFPPPSSPNPIRTVKPTKKGLVWQQQLLATKQPAAQRCRTPAVRAAVDAAALVVAHSVALPDEYFSLDLLDSWVATSHPTVFLTHALPYHSSAPHIWDLSKPPATYQEAVAHSDRDKWLAVMDTEKLAMDEKGVFDPAPVQTLPSGKRAIGLHWVFVWKDTDDGKVANARIVAQGHLQ